MTTDSKRSRRAKARTIALKAERRRKAEARDVKATS